MTKKSLNIFITCVFLVNTSLAADVPKKESLVPNNFGDDTKFLDSIDYPELQVVPRASDRLQEEAVFERDFGLFTHWTFWTAGGATFVTSLMHNSKTKETNPTVQQTLDSENATKFAFAAGLGTISLGVALFLMQPYNSKLESIKKYKPTGRRGELYKERMAEEGLENISKYVKIISYLTPVVNFTASANVFDKADDNVRMYAGIAMLTSLLPLIFTDSYITNYEKHLEYKRKIYAPIVSSSFIPSMKDGNIPSIAAFWSFE